MLTTLRKNERLRDILQDLASIGRQSYENLLTLEKENVLEACIESLSQDDIAEIIINGIDETSLHEIIAESILAKNSVDLHDALYEIVPESKKYIATQLENYIDMLLGEAIGEQCLNSGDLGDYLDSFNWVSIIAIKALQRGA